MSWSWRLLSAIMRAVTKVLVNRQKYISYLPAPTSIKQVSAGAFCAQCVISWCTLECTPPLLFNAFKPVKYEQEVLCSFKTVLKQAAIKILLMICSLPIWYLYWNYELCSVWRLSGINAWIAGPVTNLWQSVPGSLGVLLFPISDLSASCCRKHEVKLVAVNRYFHNLF